jgi:peptidyl-tRNA hydrolase
MPAGKISAQVAHAIIEDAGYNVFDKPTNT